MASHVFGVDVGGTTIKLGLFDSNGNVIDKCQHRSSGTPGRLNFQTFSVHT